MDLYLPCTQRFLDVSEFTVIGDGEQFVSPLIRHLPNESHQEFEVQDDPLDDLELLTPFINEEARTVSDREPSDFDFEPENSSGDSFERYPDMDNSSDMQD